VTRASPPSAAARLGPARATALVGRASVLARAAGALRRGVRLLTLRGPPGVGKTAVARALALRAEAPRARATAPFVRLVGLTRRADALAAIAVALGTPLRARDPRVAFERTARALDAAPGPVFLDGLDTHAPELAALVADLLDATESAQLVVTAWRALGLPDERVLPVAPLAATAAARLFARRVAHHHAAHAGRRQRLALAPDARAALLARAGGLPLAIEVLAARVAALGADAVLDALARHGLRGEARDDVLDAAWSAIPDADRHALVALAVAIAPSPPAHAAELVGGPDALGAIERLTASSLVASTRAEGAVWVSLLDAVRDHALRRAEPARLEAARARHAALFARRPASPTDDADAWATLPRQRGDLLAAWRWAVAARDRRLALALALRLDPLLVTQGPAALHLAVLDGTLALLDVDRAEALDAEARATALELRLALGRHHALRGAHRAALEAFREAARDAEALDDAARLGWASAFITFSAGRAGTLEEALASGARALALGHLRRDLRLVAMAEQALGLVRLSVGDGARAEVHLRHALAAASVAGAPRLQGIASANLGLAALEAGALDDAAAHFEAARRAFASIDDRFHLARLAAHLGALAARRGEPDAEAQLMAALAQAVAHDDRDGELWARAALVETARALGDAALAAARLDALAVLAAEVDDPTWARRVTALRVAGRDERDDEEEDGDEGEVTADVAAEPGASSAAAAPREGSRPARAGTMGVAIGVAAGVAAGHGAPGWASALGARAIAEAEAILGFGAVPAPFDVDEDTDAGTRLDDADDLTVLGVPVVMPSEPLPPRSPDEDETRISAQPTAPLDEGETRVASGRAALGADDDDATRVGGAVRGVFARPATPVVGRRAHAPRAHLRLTRDGRMIELDARRLDFSRWGPLRRVLLALVAARLDAPGAALDAHAVREAGWPGERMLPESASARVYMAILRLRELGFEGVLETRDDGYALDPLLVVEWLDDDEL
jgi:hypothetical protein